MSLALAMALFGATAVVIDTCIVLILRKLRVSGSSLISKQRSATQHQLLNALIVQTFIPKIFSYIPLGMIFTVPLLGLNLTGVYGDLMIMAPAIFPSLDPIIMLYFVR
ncbi:hypothetical protein PENTCL1PPCAC_14306, partial [Pristionchus entomophagus]